MRDHLTIRLTVLEEPQAKDLSLGVGPQRVPGVRLCEPSRIALRPSFLSLNCRVAFRQLAHILACLGALRTEAPKAQWHHPILPTVALTRYPFLVVVPKGATSVTFTTMKPLAQIHRELDIRNLQLWEFVP